MTRANLKIPIIKVSLAYRDFVSWKLSGEEPWQHDKSLVEI